MTVDEQRANRVEAVAPIVAQPDEEIEPALTHPDLRRVLSDEANPHGADDVAGREPDASSGVAVHRDLQLRQAP